MSHHINMGKIAIQQNRTQTHDGHDQKRKRKTLQQRKARASQSLEFSTRIAAGTAHLDVMERPDWITAGSDIEWYFKGAGWLGGKVRGWHGDHSLKLVISPPDGIRWPSPVPPGQSILIAYKPELVRRPPKAFQFALPPGVKSRMVLEVKVQEASILWTVPPGLQRGQMVKIYVQDGRVVASPAVPAAVAPITVEAQKRRPGSSPDPAPAAPEPPAAELCGPATPMAPPAPPTTTPLYGPPKACQLISAPAI